jgi:hypothetical protein
LPNLWGLPLFRKLPQAASRHMAHSQPTAHPTPSGAWASSRDQLRLKPGFRLVKLGERDCTRGQRPETDLQEPLALLVSVDLVIQTDQHRNQLVLQKYEATFRVATSSSDPDRLERQGCHK